MNVIIDDVLAEIHEAIGRDTTRQPGEITITEYSERYGITRDQARNALRGAVHKGILEKRQIFEDGKTVNVYRLVKK